MIIVFLYKMDKDIDIYADLPSFNTNDPEDHCTSSAELTKKCNELTKQVNDLTEKVKKLEKENATLEVNLFSLLKTAKAEITRKDRMIADLRKQVDDVVFKRRNSACAVPHHRKFESVPHLPPTIRNPVPSINENTATNITYTMESEVTSTDTDNPVYVEDQYNHHKAVVSQKKLQETVFGKRLRKRILDEEKEAAMKKEAELKVSAESSSHENIKESRVKHDVDNDANNASVTQKDLSTTAINLLLITNSSHKLHSSEVSAKRPSEDVFHLPPNKRKKSNDAHVEDKVEPDSQYNSDFIDSKSCRSTNSKNTFVDRRYQGRNNYIKYDREKNGNNCFNVENNRDSRSIFPSEEYDSNVDRQCNDFRKRQYYKKDFDEKRDNRCKSADRKLQSRSRERSRERSVYNERNREFNSYDKEKHYQQHSKLAERRYGNKNYDKYYPDTHVNYRSNSRNRDNFKEKDSNSSSPFRREVYDLRNKVSSKYEKKSDFIYYESSKYKKEKLAIEVGRRTGRSPSINDKNKDNVISTRCNESAENTKADLKETETLENENLQQNYTADKAEIAPLEDGELTDTPNSNPIKNNTSKCIKTSEISHVNKTRTEDHLYKDTRNNENILKQPAETKEALNQVQSNETKEQNLCQQTVQISTDVAAAPYEEAIENIQEFIKNYDNQEETNHDHVNSKKSSKEAYTHLNQKTKGVVDIAAKIDKTVEKLEENKGDEKDKEEISIKSSAENNSSTNGSDHSNTGKLRSKFRIPKLKSKELGDLPISENAPDQTHDTIVNLSGKLDGIIKADGTSKCSPIVMHDPKPKDNVDVVTVTNCENVRKNLSNALSVNNRVHINTETVYSEILQTDKKLNVEKEGNDVLLKDSGLNHMENKTVQDDTLLTKSKNDSELYDEGNCSGPNKFVSQPVESVSNVKMNEPGSNDERHLSNPSKLEGNSINEKNIENSIEDNKQKIKFEDSNPKMIENKNSTQRNNDRSKVIVARRRKPVQLGDVNASMTVVMNSNNITCNNNVNNTSDSSNNLKPRACKLSRSYKKIS